MQTTSIDTQDLQAFLSCMDQMGSYKAYGQDGILVVFNPLTKVTLRHGKIPNYCEHNVKMLYNMGWKKAWLSRLYGKPLTAIDKLIKSNNSGVNRLFNDIHFIGEAQEIRA